MRRARSSGSRTKRGDTVAGPGRPRVVSARPGGLRLPMRSSAPSSELFPASLGPTSAMTSSLRSSDCSPANRRKSFSLILISRMDQPFRRPRLMSGVPRPYRFSVRPIHCQADFGPTSGGDWEHLSAWWFATSSGATATLAATGIAGVGPDALPRGRSRPRRRTTERVAMQPPHQPNAKRRQPEPPPTRPVPSGGIARHLHCHTTCSGIWGVLPSCSSNVVSRTSRPAWPLLARVRRQRQGTDRRKPDG